MISIEQDTHGRTYQIWKQQQANSCGVASVWMARGIAGQASFAEEEWDLAVRMYMGAVAGALGTLGVSPSGPMTFNPDAYAANQSTMANTFASFGLYAAQVATALRNERLRVDHTTLSGNPPRIAHNKIAYNKPAIVLIAWDGGGGHFVVVGRCTHNEVSFLDPWNGHVNQQRNNGKYSAPYGGQGSIVEILYISA
jgi:hypothetical protein